MVGETISHYNIIEKLGEGGMGVVYKAHDIKLDRVVALKFLPTDATANEEDKARFIQEARAAAKLSHPNICGIHSIGEHEDRQFIEMEYVEGQTLREQMREGDRSLETVITYALQIADALGEAHEQEIIHRDIKPENIMVDGKGNIKIMDFGLAKLKGMQNITKAGSTVGTTSYMSPEQIQGGEIDRRADIFSLGVVLYEMLAGQKPFRGEHEAAMMYAIINEEPVPLEEHLPEASPDLIHLTGRLLEKDPDDRYQGAGEVQGELKRIQKKSSDNIPALPTMQPESSQKEKPQASGGSTTVTISIPQFENKVGIGLSLAGVVLLAILAGWYLFSPGTTGADTAGGQSIAVLPFENQSPNPDDAYFADGVHEDIITQLSKIRDLKVIARSSVMRYPVGDRNYEQIAEELNVSTAMEGSIRRAGDVIRVSVQLIDLQTKQTLWADSYERTLRDIFAIQGEIAREITESLQVSISEEEKDQLKQAWTENTEAYEMYQRAQEYMRRPGANREDWDIAINFLEKAVDLDPQFHRAYGTLSWMHAVYYWFGFDQSPERLELSKKYADRTYELAPDDEFTHLVLGNYHYRSRNFARALNHANKTSSHELKAWIQRRLGMWEESNKNLKKEIENDPMNPGPYHELALSYLRLREYDQTEKYLKKAIEVAPDYQEAKERLVELYIYWRGNLDPVRTFVSNNPEANPWGYVLLRDFEGLMRLSEKGNQEVFTGQEFVTPRAFGLGVANHYLGNSVKAANHFEEAKNVLEEMRNERPDDYRILARLSQVYAYLHRPEDALRTINRVREMLPLEEDALLGADYLVVEAEVNAILGNAKKATMLIEKALDIPSRISVHSLTINPVWDPIREHESFQKIVEGV